MSMRRPIRFWSLLFILGLGAWLRPEGRADQGSLMKHDFSGLAQPGVHRETLDFGEHERKFIVVTPENGASGHRLPVVFFFHGAGGNAEQAMRTYGWAEKAQTEHFLAVFPEGLGAKPDRPGSFLLNPNIWRDGRVGQPAPEINDVGFFAELLRLLEASAPVDQNRIFVTGFSNGAAMTFTLGARFADRIAAIAPVSSQSFARETSLPRPLPVYYLVGMADPLVPYDGRNVRLIWGTRLNHPPIQESLDQWLRLDGCGTAPISENAHEGVDIATYGGPSPGSVIVFTRVEGNGHHWPGTVEPLPEAISGPRLDPFDATDVIWKFFQTHPLSP
jgi:polyhydroxybutyrate depolymerase